MSRRMLGGSLRFRAVSEANRPSIPSASKLSILRRSVESETPVCSARSTTGSPNSTGWRMRSYSTCSGHQHSGNISWKSSVCSIRGCLPAMRFPSLLDGAGRSLAPVPPPRASAATTILRARSMTRLGVHDHLVGYILEVVTSGSEGRYVSWRIRLI